MMRLRRIIESWLNELFGTFEDPEVILKNNIREMRESIPKLNEGVIKIQATVSLLRNDIAESEETERILIYKIKAAAKSNDNEYGIDLSMQLKKLRETREKNKITLTSAEKGLESMKAIREAQLVKVKNEIARIQSTIDDAKTAHLKGEISSLFTQYSINDVATSNNEMLGKIKRQTAEDNSKFDDTNDSFDIKILKLDNDADKMAAKDIFEEYKKEFTKSVKLKK